MGSKKRKKLRVASRKNRRKRARKTDLTRELLDEDLEADELSSRERVAPGELTRKRTIVGEVDEQAGEVVREVDLTRCEQGRVLKAVGNHCTVQAASGRRHECTIRRVVRTMARDQRNPVVAGDRVLFLPLDEESGVIERVEPRQSVVSRGSHGREHVIVANVEQVLIVASADEPPLKTGLIDRMLISAEKGGVAPVVCINKIDLVDPAELQPVAGMYARLGYHVVLCSAVQADQDRGSPSEGAGLARLRELLTDRQTALAGQSGVGKSSILNVLQPGLNLKVAEISESTRKGRHTTRAAALHELDFGGWVVDTPGIREFGLWEVLPEEVEGFYVEFRPFVTLCRFPDCTHTHEDGCGVKRAVSRDLIARERYENYCRIVAGDDL